MHQALTHSLVSSHVLVVAIGFTGITGPSVPCVGHASHPLHLPLLSCALSLTVSPSFIVPHFLALEHSPITTNNTSFVLKLLSTRLTWRLISNLKTHMLHNTSNPFASTCSVLVYKPSCPFQAWEGCGTNAIVLSPFSYAPTSSLSLRPLQFPLHILDFQEHSLPLPSLSVAPLLSPQGHGPDSDLTFPKSPNSLAAWTFHLRYSTYAVHDQTDH